MDSALAEAYASLQALERRLEWHRQSMATLKMVVLSRPKVANMNTPGYVAFDRRCVAALALINEREPKE